MDIAFGFNRFDMRDASAFAASVARGEALGFDVAFVPSSPLLAQDPYILLAAAARETQSIRLGPMLENPVTRHPAVIAGSVATLDRVSAGRAILALGVGDTAVRTLGLRPAKVNELADATRMVKALLSGESFDFGKTSSKLRHAAPVPVMVAAGGPRALAMAGALADGVIIRVGTDPANLSIAIQRVHEGAREAGREPASVRIACVFHTVLTDNEDHCAKIGRAIAAGYYEYAPYLFDNAGLAWDGPDIEVLKASVWQDFHHTPDLVAAGELVDFLPDAAVDAFCLHGDGQTISTKIDAFHAAHPEVSLIVPHPMTPPAPRGATPHLDFMEAFAEAVIA